MSVTRAALPAGTLSRPCGLWGQDGGTVTMSCPGSLLRDSPIYPCEMQHSYSIYYWLFLAEWPVSICQSNSLGTKPAAQEAASCPGHRWVPGGWVQIAAKSWCPGQVLILCLSCCQHCLLEWDLLHLSKNFWFFGGGISVCPVLWSMTTAPAFCSDRNDTRAICPNGFVHNTVDSRDLRNSSL